MKKFVICILTLLVLVPLAPLAASADTFILNTTQVLPYRGGSAAPGYGSWMDNVPTGDSLFKIFGYSIGYTNPSHTDVTLNIYTNMPQGGDTNPNIPVGDLFLNLDGTGFTQAVKLPASGNSGTLLDVTGVSTSKDLWTSRTGYYYAGEYRTSLSSSGAIPVQATGSTVSPATDGSFPSSTITATWDDNHTTNPGDYILSILFPGLDGNNGNHLIFLWASGTCGNGTIYADVDLTHVSPPQVPVPPSALLLATGLLGLALLRKWGAVK